MVEKKKTPHLRIAGFTSEWHEGLLNQYLKTSLEKNTEEKFSREDVLSVSGDYGVVNQIEFQGRSFAGASVANYGVVHTGDVVYTKSPLKENPYGIIKTNIGKPGIVSTLYAIYHPTDDTYPEFVQLYFENKDRLNRYLNPLVNKGAKNDMKVSSDNALLGTVIFPEYNEQKVISDALANIKTVILQYETKLQKLQTIRSTMLEAMFPKAGADVPEIRFKGFVQNWKRRSFSELYEKVTIKNDLSFGTDSIISVANMYFKPDAYVTDPEYLRTYNVFRLGDIAFEGNKSKNFSHGRFVENTIGDGIVSHVFDVFRPITEYDLLYWKYAINNERIMGRILVRCTKASTMMTNLVAKDFFEETILVPEVEEQKKIGSYFDQLDKLIALYEQELRKLQSIKKALLEKMFV